MIRINQLNLPLNYTNLDIKKLLERTLQININDIEKIEILKKSIDSRKQDNIKYILNVAVKFKNQENFLNKNSNYKENIYIPLKNSLDDLLESCNLKAIDYRPVIVGMGPAGLFCAMLLARAGYKPILVERGQCVEKRNKAVRDFWHGKNLNLESNIQFGEGGAGTFSDGKLNTGVGGDKINIVLNEFVRFGAKKDILIDSKPHIGTDILIDIVKNMRNHIIELGGEVLFETKFVDAHAKNNELRCVQVEDATNGKYEISTKKCIIAIGHSSRDTFEMLSKKIVMAQKPFAIGVRIEHLQEMISFNQFGNKWKELPPADYKLACHLGNGRSCFSFCMCPGGYVVPATSQLGGVVTNGMSNNLREGKNANSALLVNVEPKDFGSQDVLAGMHFQMKYEKKAFEIAGSNYKAPVQRFEDFERGVVSQSYGKVKPTYARGVEMANLQDCLPNFVYDSLTQAIKIFDKKIKGFAGADSLLTGVETRTSSPVKILRNETGDSNIKGLMPCGEGAGYAGGITSACIDGIVQALNLINNL